MTAQIEDRLYFQRRVFSVVDASDGALFNPEDFGVYVASADDACRRGCVAEFAVEDEERLIIRNLYASPLDVKSELGRLAVERLSKKRELTQTLAASEDNFEEAERLRAEIASLEAEFPGFENEDEFYRDLLARTPDEAPLLDGAAPIPLNADDVIAGCRFLYEQIDLPLDYTGTLLIGADCVFERDVDDALDETSEGTTSYKTLLELNFENGVLQSAVDCSNFGGPRASTVNEIERAVEAADDARSVADWLERAFDDDFLSRWNRKAD